MTSCMFPGCDRRVKAKGCCMAHYLQRRRGVPLKSLRGSVSLADRLAERTDRSGECWVWTGTRNAGGYGRIHHNGKGRMAHRLAYELANGPIPDGLPLDHICHNPACVRPDHLHPVTAKQNAENRAGPTRVNQSGVRGVTKAAHRGWVAKVKHNGRLYHGGYFASITDAEAAVVDLRNRLFTNNLMDHSAPAEIATNPQSITLDNLEVHP